MVYDENVTRFLQEKLTKKSSSPYYWIGMQKINGNWTWVANGQTANYENWADNEPNNNLSNENCVELYISKGNNSGKWNDESCEYKKHPVCQTGKELEIKGALLVQLVVFQLEHV